MYNFSFSVDIFVTSLQCSRPVLNIESSKRAEEFSKAVDVELCQPGDVSVGVEILPCHGSYDNEKVI